MCTYVCIFLYPNIYMCKGSAIKKKNEKWELKKEKNKEKIRLF